MKHACLSICFIALLTLVPTTQLSAQTPTGFTVDYLDSWPLNNQIKFIRVVITPISGTSTEDIDFYVVGRSAGFQTGVTVSTKIEIRRGDASATGEMLIPVCNGYSFSLHTETDGNLKSDMRDFAKHYYNDYNYGVGARNGMAPSFVLASSEVVADESSRFVVLTNQGSSKVPRSVAVGTTDDFPELEDLKAWYGSTTVVGGGRKYQTINGFSSNQTATMSLGALPSRWFGYEGLGAVMITCDDLAELAKYYPGKMLAIERWVAASGRLIVLECGEKVERTFEVLKHLGDSDAGIRNKRTCIIPGDSEIETGVLDELRVDAMELNEQYRGYPNSSAQKKKFRKKLSEGRDISTLSLEAFAQAKFDSDMVAIEFESGQIVCLSNQYSDWKTERPRDVDYWGRVGMFLESSRRSEQETHNVLGGETLRGFGFPEFAEPPRYVFEFSILVYLLAVGPVAFFVLKARKKLNLMFIVVPAISLMFCSAILAWAVFAEGFDTRVNLFSFTELNQQTGRQSTSTLSHIYSGMTPAPYRHTGSTYGFVNLPQYGRYQRIKWDDQSEELSSGEVRARTNHQMMTRCSNETDKKLAFSFKGTGESASASVRNDFETRVSGLMFRSEASGVNEVWVCEEIQPGEIAQAKRMTFSDAAKLLRELVQSRGSKTVLATEGSYSFIEELDSYNNSIRNVYPPQQERGIGDIGVVSKLNTMWRFNTGTLKSMLFAPSGRVYIGLTDKCTNHDSAIEDAVFETEIHILRGVR